MSDDGSATTGASDGMTGTAVRGLEAYLAGDTARDLLEAVDVDAVLDGRPIAEAIDRELGAQVLGQLLGQVLADEFAGDGRLSGFAARLFGRRVGGRVGRLAVLALLEYGLLAVVIDRLRDRTTDDGVLQLLEELEATALEDDLSRTDPGDDRPSGPERERDDPSYRGPDDFGTTRNGRRRSDD